MKKTFIGICSFVIVSSLLYMLVTTSLHNHLRNKVITQHPEIEQVHSVTRIGAWGEWFSEYVLNVEIEGELFRIWVNKEGQITDKESVAF